jgi:hypothetical protein
MGLFDRLLLGGGDRSRGTEDQERGGAEAAAMGSDVPPPSAIPPLSAAAASVVRQCARSVLPDRRYAYLRSFLGSASFFPFTVTDRQT